MTQEYKTSLEEELIRALQRKLAEDQQQFWLDLPKLDDEQRTTRTEQLLKDSREIRKLKRLFESKQKKETKRMMYHGDAK